MRHASRLAGLALLILGMAVSFTAVGGGPATASERCPVADVSLDAEEMEFIQLLNDYRAANGAGPLDVSPGLTRAATWMAVDMGTNDLFGHQDSFGRDAYTRIADCGYGGPAGENLAAGKRWESAERALQAWKDSSEHNRNMLLSRYVVVGVARFHAPDSRHGWYWATAFGTEPDPMAAAAAQPAATATPAATAMPTVAAPGPSAATVALRPGANLVAWPAARTDARSLAQSSDVRVVYAWDPAAGGWKRYGPHVPEYANTLTSLVRGEAYWVISGSGGELRLAE